MNPFVIQSHRDLEFAVEIMYRYVMHDAEIRRAMEQVIGDPEMTPGDIFTFAFKSGMSFAMVQMVKGQIKVQEIQGPGG